MPTLVAAEGALLERVYDDTWPIWHDGLSRADYERFNRAQMMTEWGAANLARVAWVEGDELLASAKRYRIARNALLLHSAAAALVTACRRRTPGGHRTPGG